MTSQQKHSFTTVNVSVNGVVKNVIIPFYKPMSSPATSSTLNAVTPTYASASINKIPILPTSQRYVANSVRPTHVILPANPHIVTNSTAVLAVPSLLTVAKNRPRQVVPTSAPIVTSILSTVRLPITSSRTSTVAVETTRPSTQVLTLSSDKLGLNQIYTLRPSIASTEDGSQLGNIIHALKASSQITSVAGAAMKTIQITKDARFVMRNKTYVPVKIITPVSNSRIVQCTSASTEAARARVALPAAIQVSPPKRTITILRSPSGKSQLVPQFHSSLTSPRGLSNLRFVVSSSIQRNEPSPVPRQSSLNIVAFPRSATNDSTSFIDDQLMKAELDKEEKMPEYNDDDQRFKVIEIVPDDDERSESEDLGRQIVADENIKDETVSVEDFDNNESSDPLHRTVETSQSAYGLNEQIFQSDMNLIESSPEKGTPSDDLSPTSNRSRPGIFEALNKMSLDEMRSIASMTGMSLEEIKSSYESSDLISSVTANPDFNVVLLGEDHVVIENPGFEENDEADETINTDETRDIQLPSPEVGGMEESYVWDSGTGIRQMTMPSGLSNVGDVRPNIKLNLDKIRAHQELKLLLISGLTKSKSSNSKITAKRQMAKRTGGRPLELSKRYEIKPCFCAPTRPTMTRYLVKRTGGRPLKPLERYGVAVKDCFVSLEKLFMRKNYVRWINRHLYHVLCCVEGKIGMPLKFKQRKKLKIAAMQAAAETAMTKLNLESTVVVKRTRRPNKHLHNLPGEEVEVRRRKKITYSVTEESIPATSSCLVFDDSRHSECMPPLLVRPNENEILQSTLGGVDEFDSMPCTLDGEDGSEIVPQDHDVQDDSDMAAEHILVQRENNMMDEPSVVQWQSQLTAEPNVDMLQKHSKRKRSNVNAGGDNVLHQKSKKQKKTSLKDANLNVSCSPDETTFEGNLEQKPSKHGKKQKKGKRRQTTSSSIINATCLTSYEVLNSAFPKTNSSKRLKPKCFVSSESTNPDNPQVVSSTPLNGKSRRLSKLKSGQASQEIFPPMQNLSSPKNTGEQETSSADPDVIRSTPHNGKSRRLNKLKQVQASHEIIPPVPDLSLPQTTDEQKTSSADPEVIRVTPKNKKSRGLKKSKKGQASQEINPPMPELSLPQTTGEEEISSVDPEVISATPQNKKSRRLPKLKKGQVSQARIPPMPEQPDPWSQQTASTGPEIVPLSIDPENRLILPKIETVEDTATLTTTKKKFLLIKTRDGSYLLPFEGQQASGVLPKLVLSSPNSISLTDTNKGNATEFSSASTEDKEDNVTTTLTTLDSSTSAEATTIATSVSDVSNSSKGDQEAGYESAAAGMTPKDRISHLKELLRLQQEKLDQRRKQKDKE